MTKNELTNKKSKELRKIAWELKIPRVKSFKKDELIEEILRLQSPVPPVQEEISSTIDLTEKTVKELQVIARGLKIPNIKSFKKEQLLIEILRRQTNTQEETPPPLEVQMENIIRESAKDLGVNIQDEPSQTNREPKQPRRRERHETKEYISIEIPRGVPLSFKIHEVATRLREGAKALGIDLQSFVNNFGEGYRAKLKKREGRVLTYELFFG